MYKGERTNAITHLAGAVAAVVGSAVLVAWAADGRRLLSFGIYGLTLVLLYLASTLYHSIRPPLKQVFRRFDHAAIYLLIAGSYAPFALVTLPPSWGWPLFAGVVLLAIAGIVFVFLPEHRGPGLRWKAAVQMVLYLGMGWLAVVALRPLSASLAPPGLFLLVAGGALYTLGTIPYALKSLRRGHEIWHIFVLGGSTCHYFAILLYV